MCISATELLPRNLSDVDGFLELSDIIQDELKHSVILPADVIQKYDVGWWYLGVRKYGRCLINYYFYRFVFLLSLL